MTIAERIRFFNFIRDIPYQISLYPGMTDYCCSTKSLMLARLLETLGLQTEQVICSFDWDQTPLPQDILPLPHDRSETTHQFMRVFIPESQSWVDLDPTWDSGLRKLGFRVEEWDGLNSTGIAVIPIKIFSPEEAWQMHEKYGSPEVMNAYINYHRSLFQAINTLFAQTRGSPT